MRERRIRLPENPQRRRVRLRVKGQVRVTPPPHRKHRLRPQNRLPGYHQLNNCLPGCPACFQAGRFPFVPAGSAFGRGWFSGYIAGCRLFVVPVPGRSGKSGTGGFFRDMITNRVAPFPSQARKNGDPIGSPSCGESGRFSAGCYSSIKSMFTCRWNASCSEIWVSVEETP